MNSLCFPHKLAIHILIQRAKCLFSDPQFLNSWAFIEHLMYARNEKIFGDCFLSD